MMYGWDGWGWGGMLLMTVVMVAFWAFVITAIVLGVRYVSGGGSSHGPQTLEPSRAAGVLADRFARGEIDEDEFRRRMMAIREHQSS
jgi:putative membrane protein